MKIKLINKIKIKNKRIRLFNKNLNKKFKLKV